MTPEERALRNMWMQELWKPCREVDREQRAEQRKQDWATRRELEELAALNKLPSVVPDYPTGGAQTCAQIGPEIAPEAPAEAG